MPLTHSYRDTLHERIQRDPAFRVALFQEAMQVLMDGELGTARSVLRDYINATVGFEALGAATGLPPKSLMRMFGPKGNPTAANLLAVVAALQAGTGVHLQVLAVANAA